MRLGTSITRRFAALAALATLSALVGVPSAHAAPTSGCSTSDPTFCASYSIDIDAAGTTTPATAAATPADFTFGFANTSEAHATNTSEWLNNVVISLADGRGPVITPSSDLDENLLVAGSASNCGTNTGNFTACTAGYGTFYANVSGTPSDNGIHSGTFGIERIVNSHNSSDSAIDWSLTIAFCLNTSLGTCDGTSPVLETIEVKSPSQAGATIVLPAASSFDIPVSATVTAHIDSAIDSMQGVHLLGTSGTLASGDPAPSGSQTVLHLPDTCGPTITAALFTDHASDFVAIPGSLSVTGCPTAGLSSSSLPTSKVRFNGSSSATPLAPGRSIKHWYWFFGDGHHPVTTTPVITHTYQTSRDSTVALFVQDSLGAFSSAKTITLDGAKITLNASHATIVHGHPVKLSGRLRRWHTTTGLTGMKVSVLKCNAHGKSCHVITTKTTTSGGTFAVKVKPSHTSVYEARFVHNGYIGTIAKRKVKVTR